MRARLLIGFLAGTLPPLLAACPAVVDCPEGAHRELGVCTDVDDVSDVPDADGTPDEPPPPDATAPPPSHDDAGPPAMDSSTDSGPGDARVDGQIDATSDTSADSAPSDGSSPADAAPTACYVDQDGDGFGSLTPVDCTAWADAGNDAALSGDGGTAGRMVNVTGDCDDKNPGRSPAASELCDGIDNDCDGVKDEDVRNPCGGTCTRPFAHLPGETCTNGLLGMCAREGTYACVNDAAVACSADPVPASKETCGDNIDNDCDGSTDEADAINAPFWYQDCDGDGFAASTTNAQPSCTKPANLGACSWTPVFPQPLTRTNWDCNDSDAAYFPGTTAYGYAGPSGDGDLSCDGKPLRDALVDTVWGRLPFCGPFTEVACVQMPGGSTSPLPCSRTSADVVEIWWCRAGRASCDGEPLNVSQRCN